MSYTVEFTPAARRQLKKLPSDIQERLRILIRSLASDPRPSGCQKLKGKFAQYRVRSGEYRVTYSIEDAKLIVTIIKAGHRRDVYREK